MIIFLFHLQVMNGNMYKSIATSEMDDNASNLAALPFMPISNGTMTSTLQKLQALQAQQQMNGEIYKPQPIYDNTIQTRKLPDLPACKTPESLGRIICLLFFFLNFFEE